MKTISDNLTGMFGIPKHPDKRSMPCRVAIPSL